MIIVFGWYIQYLFTINDTMVDAAASGGAACTSREELKARGGQHWIHSPSSAGGVEAVPPLPKIKFTFDWKLLARF